MAYDQLDKQKEMLIIFNMFLITSKQLFKNGVQLISWLIEFHFESASLKWQPFQQLTGYISLFFKSTFLQTSISYSKMASKGSIDRLSSIFN